MRSDQKGTSRTIGGGGAAFGFVGIALDVAAAAALAEGCTPGARAGEGTGAADGAGEGAATGALKVTAGALGGVAAGGSEDSLAFVATGARVIAAPEVTGPPVGVPVPDIPHAATPTRVAAATPSPIQRGLFERRAKGESSRSIDSERAPGPVPGSVGATGRGADGTKRGPVAAAPAGAGKSIATGTGRGGVGTEGTGIAVVSTLPCTITDSTGSDATVALAGGCVPFARRAETMVPRTSARTSAPPSERTSLRERLAAPPNTATSGSHEGRKALDRRSKSSAVSSPAANISGVAPAGPERSPGEAITRGSLPPDPEPNNARPSSYSGCAAGKRVQPPRPILVSPPASLSPSPGELLP